MESFPYAVYVYPIRGIGHKLIGPTHDFAKAFDCYTKAAQSGEHVVLFDQCHQGGFSPRFEANRRAKYGQATNW